MGHYYSDLACDACGHLPCACPRSPRKEINKFYIELALAKPLNFRNQQYTFEIHQIKYESQIASATCNGGAINFFDTEQQAKDYVQFEVEELKTRILNKAKKECDRLDNALKYYLESLK